MAAGLAVAGQQQGAEGLEWLQLQHQRGPLQAADAHLPVGPEGELEGSGAGGMALGQAAQRTDAQAGCQQPVGRGEAIGFPRAVERLELHRVADRPQEGKVHCRCRGDWPEGISRPSVGRHLVNQPPYSRCALLDPERQYVHAL